MHLAVLFLLANQELLPVMIANRNRDATSDNEFLHQIFGYLGGTRRNQNLVVRSKGRQTLSTVSLKHVHITDTELRHSSLSWLRKLDDDFNGINFLNQLSEERRRIARARAHFQHAVRRLQGKGIQHHRDHARLTDSLAIPERERDVLVCTGAYSLRNEAVPRNARKSVYDARIVDSHLTGDMTGQSSASFTNTGILCAGQLEIERGCHLPKLVTDRVAWQCLVNSKQVGKPGSRV